MSANPNTSRSIERSVLFTLHQPFDVEHEVFSSCEKSICSPCLISLSIPSIYLHFLTRSPKGQTEFRIRKNIPWKLSFARLTPPKSIPLGSPCRAHLNPFAVPYKICNLNFQVASTSTCHINEALYARQLVTWTRLHKRCTDRWESWVENSAGGASWCLTPTHTNVVSFSISE